MDNPLVYLITGGFLKGYRTYIVVALGVASAVASYSMGDTDLVHTAQNVFELLGLSTVRAAVPHIAK